MIRKTSFLLTTLLCIAFTLSAQTDAPKYGHMNLGNLLDELPQTTAAEAQLRVFADSLNRKDSLLTSEFQAAYLQLKKEYDEGQLTPVQAQQRQAVLEQQRQEIQNYEQGAQQLLEAKRGELLQPILGKVNDAIAAVAKKNGFLMIFDISSGSLLFASETIDVTALVKKELGL
ncbi:MAG: OmpH family outer membrane protein [Lewinellaceae bacterium]|nr:OmpH family outer membrane protein [Lewinellaceae bacterium]